MDLLILSYDDPTSVGVERSFTMNMAWNTVSPLSPEGSDRQVDSVPRMGLFGDVASTVEHIHVLLSMESSCYQPTRDYLAQISGADLQPSEKVSENWRRKLAEWCYEVIDHFNFDREVCSIAINFLDRVVATKTEGNDSNIPRREFQLIAVTCLYIAIKLHGECDSFTSPRLKLKIHSFVELSRGYFPVQVIEAMERNVLESLNWRVNPPTAMRYIHSYLHLCPKWSVLDHATPHNTVFGGIYDLSRYLAELSVCSSLFAFQYKPSQVAYACIISAIEVSDGSLALPYKVRVKFLNNLAEATGLLPQTREMRNLRTELKLLCPNIFVNDVSAYVEYDDNSESLSDESTHEDGKASPVCVMDSAQEDSPRTRRKRSRSIADDSAQLRSN